MNAILAIVINMTYITMKYQRGIILEKLNSLTTCILYRSPTSICLHRCNSLPLPRAKLSIYILIYIYLASWNVHSFCCYLRKDCVYSLPHLYSGKVDKDASVNIHLKITCRSSIGGHLWRFHHGSQSTPIKIVIIFPGHVFST